MLNILLFLLYAMIILMSIYLALSLIDFGINIYYIIRRRR